MFPFFFSTLLLLAWLTDESSFAITTVGYDNDENHTSYVGNSTQLPFEEKTQFLNAFEEESDANSHDPNEFPISDALSTTTVSLFPEEEDHNNLFSSEEELLTTTVENCSFEGTCANKSQQPMTETTRLEVQLSSTETSSTTSLGDTETFLTNSSPSANTTPPTLENHIPVEKTRTKENIFDRYSSLDSHSKENVSYLQTKKISGASKSIFTDLLTTVTSFHTSNDYTETTTVSSYSIGSSIYHPVKPITVNPTSPTVKQFSDYGVTIVSTDANNQSKDFFKDFITSDSDANFSTEVSEGSTTQTLFLDVTTNVSQNANITLLAMAPLSEKTPTGNVTPSVKSVTKSVYSNDSTNKSSKASEEKVTSPQPKLTNPTCAMLPICVKVRLMSEPLMCLPIENEKMLKTLRDAIAEALFEYSKPSVHPSQIILELHPCLANPSVVLFFVTDSSAEYEEVLTVLAGVLIKKLINILPPTKFPFEIIEAEILGMESKVQEILSATPPPIPTTNSGMVAAVAISAVAGACLCLLCILLLVMKHRLASQQPQQCSQTINNYSLDSFSINASFRRRPHGLRSSAFMNHAFVDDENGTVSKPISSSTLATLLQRKNVLEREFQRIPMNMHKLDEVPPGAECKNRYANVVPNPQTRVQLSDKSDDPVKTYINANYVQGSGGRAKFYIACQAPLHEHISDFWRMVWEQQSHLILMLTLLQENGVSRCAAYFPENTLDCRQLHGNYEVSLIRKDVREFYTASTLKLYDIEKKLFREVLHLWYKAWPSPDASSLVAFVLQARPYINCNPGPTIVHCSAGTGRTGVFMALDICMREYDNSRTMDVIQCVSRIRMDRGGAVQNAEQYLLIHEALMEYTSLAANQSNRPSVCSSS